MRYTVGYYGSTNRKDWGGTLTGASSGFKMGSSIGMAFGPVIGGIAGGAGALIGGIFGNSAENKRKRQQAKLDAEINTAKQNEKLRTTFLQKKQLKSNDSNYLANLDMNETNSLFMKKGGWIQKATASIKRRGTAGKCTPMSKPGCTGRALALAKTFHKMAKNREDGGEVYPSHKRMAEAGAKEYRDNIAKFDSLRTILRPHLMKSKQDHLKSSEIKQILGDEGHTMYNKISSYLSNAYSVNPKLKVSMDEFKGSLENPNSRIANYYYGTRIDKHTFPNAEFPITETSNGETKEIYKAIAYPDNTLKPKYVKSNGGKLATTGISLKGGNKLLTKNGSTSGTHESGQNIPIKRNGETLAIAEPGEVLVNDKDISNVPFVLSKRLGFAQDFMKLEQLKNIHNSKIIEDRQSKIVDMNNRMVTKKKFAYNGVPLDNIMPKNNNPFGLQKTNNTYKSSKEKRLGNIFGDIKNNFKGLDMNTIAGAAGTIGNLIMSNQTLKRQKGLVQNSLNEALAYTPNLNKNYLLNDKVDINDQVSNINQGYSSATSNLSGIDPAIASAIKSSVNNTRVNQLGSIFANRNNAQIGIRNQNTANIMSNNNANNALLNDTALMKLNAKIAANEQFGEAENARLNNAQGAISEFNTILRDRDMMDSLKARWKDSIGSDFTGKNLKCGGKLGKKRKHVMSY